MSPRSESPYHRQLKTPEMITLKDGMTRLNVPYTGEQVEKLLGYLQLLEHWNKAYNLTAVRDRKQMVTLHLLDSLAVSQHIQNKQNLIDVGSGAGLPGIPLAIINPHKQFTLLDSNGKKTRFLFQVIRELGLSNAVEVHARAEQYQPDLKFDTLLSRAFTSLPKMLKNCRHLVCDKGCFMAMKGKIPQLELSLVEKDYKVLDLCRLDIPGIEGERHLITIGR